MQLTAFAETPNWFHVTDPASGSIGYVMKSFLKIIPAVQPSVDSETRLGTLNVNGQFLIQGNAWLGLRVLHARRDVGSATKVIAGLCIGCDGGGISVVAADTSDGDGSR